MRKAVHNVSDELELGHKSRGKKKNKRICVFKSLEVLWQAIKFEQQKQ